MKRDETKDRFGRPGREVPEPIEPSSISREREREDANGNTKTQLIRGRGREEAGKRLRKLIEIFWTSFQKKLFYPFFCLLNLY